MAWYHIPGNDQDVVIRTRVRLARNLSEYPFVTRLEASHAKEIVGRTGCILEKNGFTVLEAEGFLGEDETQSDRLCFLAQKGGKK